MHTYVPNGDAIPVGHIRPTDVSRLIDKVGLKAWGHHLANDLSGGQQQRVAIAHALAVQPALVPADEPTGNLDTQSADTIFDLMRSVCQTSDITFLSVTHDPRLAKRCDRIIALVDGQIESEKPGAATYVRTDVGNDGGAAVAFPNENWVNTAKDRQPRAKKSFDEPIFKQNSIRCR